MIFSLSIFFAPAVGILLSSGCVTHFYRIALLNSFTLIFSAI